MKIAVFPSLMKPGSRQIVEGVYETLRQYGAQMIFPVEMKREFPSLALDTACEQDALNECDTVIAVGGDGTIIHTACKASLYDKPVLGINAGRLAFMAGLEGSELTLLGKLINGEYTTDERMMLHASLQRNGVEISSADCLNDVVVSRAASAGPCDFSVYRNSVEFAGYYADGLIIATPTGSTAYSLSAGGPIVEPTIESIIVTPVCAHSLGARPVIVDSGSVLEIVSVGRGIPSFSCDGARQIPMDGECRAVICKSDHSAKIIRIKNDSFLDILKKKM